MKTKLNEIRKEAENIIISVLNEAGVKKLNITDLENSGLDCGLILLDSFTDDERTVTLNEIEITKRGLLFGGSSSWEDLYLELDEVYTDILVDIANWMQNNKAEIIDLALEERAEAEDWTEDEIAYQRYLNGKYSYQDYLDVCSLQECTPNPPMND